VTKPFDGAFAVPPKLLPDGRMDLDHTVVVGNATSGGFFEAARDLNRDEAIRFRTRQGLRAFAVHCNDCIGDHWLVWVFVNDIAWGPE
jgi:hypothetical protein